MFKNGNIVTLAVCFNIMFHMINKRALLEV